MGSASRERAEELVRIVVDLYGAGLERIVDIVQGTDEPVRQRLLDRLAGDELVASLLILHDLHPQDAAERIEKALVATRRTLRTRDADVELVEIDDDGIVHLRLVGGPVDSCTEEGVTSAVTDAAPEVTGVVFEKVPASVAVAFTSKRRPSPEEAAG